MITLNKMIYSIIERINANSDDTKAEYPYKWIEYLISNKRALLIKQYYQDARKEIPVQIKQTICLDLEKYSFGTDICIDTVLRSTEQIPQKIDLNGRNDLYFSSGTLNIFLNYIPFERFKYCSTNKYLRNQVYFTVDPDNYVLVKSANEYYKLIDKIRVTGLWYDPIEAMLLDCSLVSNCNPYDLAYPIEGQMADVVEEYISKGLLEKTLTMPLDNTNNAQETEIVNKRQ